jgi:hypothetical protein
LNRASGGAGLVSRSREEAREEAVNVALYEAVQKAAESLLTRLHGDFKDSMINKIRNRIREDPYPFVSNFKVVDEHEDMVMAEFWVTVDAEVDEELLRRILRREQL